MDLLQIKMVAGTAIGLFLGSPSVMPATAQPVTEVRQVQPIAQTTSSDQMENNSDVAPDSITNDNLNNEVNNAPINRTVNQDGSLNNPINGEYAPNQMENNSDVDETPVNNLNLDNNNINRTTPNNINNVEYNEHSMQQEYEGVVESYDGSYLEMRMNDGSLRTFMVDSNDLGENVNLSPGQNVVITTQSGTTSQVNPTYPALW